jgi:hypothetical protein
MGGISCDPYHSTIGYVIVPPPLPLLEEYDEDDDKDGPVMITGEANPFAIIITGVGASAANIPGTITCYTIVNVHQEGIYFNLIPEFY